MYSAATDANAFIYMHFTLLLMYVGTYIILYLLRGWTMQSQSEVRAMRVSPNIGSDTTTAPSGLRCEGGYSNTNTV